MNAQQTDRIKGIFFGQAIGDALGLGTEFMTKKDLNLHYPGGFTDYSQIIQDYHRHRWTAGEWTDDTDQFLAICDSILKTEEVNEKAFARELHKWFNGKPRGIGMTVYEVVSQPRFQNEPHHAAAFIWEESNQNAAANGAIMRTSILGAFEFWDYAKVLANTEKIAKVTHFDPRCVGSSAIITDIIAHILNEDRCLTEAEIIITGELFDKRIRPYVELAKSSDIAALELDEGNSIGYTLKAMSAALWAYFNAPDFERGILAVINEGGDADTNAAVAGSLLGAKFGYSSIPDKYITGLRNKEVLMAKYDAFVKVVEKLKRGAI